MIETTTTTPKTPAERGQELDNANPEARALLAKVATASGYLDSGHRLLALIVGGIPSRATPQEGITHGLSQARYLAQQALDVLGPMFAPNGVDLIAAERRRQVEVRGFTAEHDDGHRCGELGSAAAFYAAGPGVDTDVGSALLALWPHGWGQPTTFEPGGFSVDGRIRELAVAGALVAAELDRLLRQKARAAAARTGGEA